jgi:hypothetical protein
MALRLRVCRPFYPTVNGSELPRIQQDALQGELYTHLEDLARKIVR